MIDLTLDYPIPSHPNWSMIDSSKMIEYMGCPRKFLFKYIFGWRSPEPNVDLVFGSAFHALMEQILIHGYNADGLMKGYEKCLEVFRETISEEEEEFLEKAATKNPRNAALIAQKYMETYVMDSYEVYGTEIGGTVQIAEDRVLTVRVDAILRDLTTRKFFLGEYKTTGMNMTPVWQAQWEPRFQVQAYLFALHQYLISKDFNADDIQGMRLDGVSIKMLKAGLSINLQRVEIPFNPEMMNAWLMEANSWFDKLEEDYERLAVANVGDAYLTAFPRCGTGAACTAYFRLCTFYPDCIMIPNPLQIFDSNPRGMEISHWNPLEDRTPKEEVQL